MKLRNTRREFLAAATGLAAATCLTSLEPAAAFQRTPQPIPSPNAPRNENVPGGLDNLPSNGPVKAPVSTVNAVQLTAMVQQLYQMATELKQETDRTNLKDTNLAPRGACYGAPTTNLDARLAKNWAVKERYQVKFSMYFFDLLNHPNFNTSGLEVAGYAPANITCGNGAACSSTNRVVTGQSAVTGFGSVQALQPGRSNRERFLEAAGLYRKAEDWDNTLPGLEKNLGQSEFRAGNDEGAISPLTQALLQQPNSNALRAMLGIAYFDLNRFAQAARTFASLGSVGMRDAQVGYAWAASLARTGDVGKATEVLTAYTSKLQPADAQLLIGQLWTALGDYPRAVSTLGAALATNPSLPKAHLDLGLAYLRSEHWPEAAKEFGAELAIAPGDPDATYHLGYVYLQQAKVEEAAQLFRQVVSDHPGYANAQYQLSKIELDRGKVPQAIAHLEAAERSDPRTDYIHYQLQAAYRKASRTEDAEKELAIYKQLKANAREQAADRVSVH